MRKLIAGLLLLTCLSAHSFEVKGIALSSDISKADLAGCTPTKNADSGMPGYVCKTTYAGAPAEIRIAVFTGKVTVISVFAENALFQPIKEALVQKYGTPSKAPNIENYTWWRGDSAMSVSERLDPRSYFVYASDVKLLNRFLALRDNPIKGDM